MFFEKIIFLYIKKEENIQRLIDELFANFLQWLNLYHGHEIHLLSMVLAKS